MKITEEFRHFADHTENAPIFSFKVQANQISLLLDGVTVLGAMEVSRDDDISLVASYLIAKQYIEEIEDVSKLDVIRKGYFPIDSEINGKKIVGTQFFEYLIQMAKEVA